MLFTIPRYWSVVYYNPVIEFLVSLQFVQSESLKPTILLLSLLKQIFKPIVPLRYLNIRLIAFQCFFSWVLVKTTYAVYRKCRNVIFNLNIGDFLLLQHMVLLSCLVFLVKQQRKVSVAAFNFIWIHRYN